MMSSVQNIIIRLLLKGLASTKAALNVACTQHPLARFSLSKYLPHCTCRLCLEMIIALGGRPGNALEKDSGYNNVAFFQCALSHVCIISWLYGNTPFHQHVTTQNWLTDECVCITRLIIVQLQAVSS